MIFRFNYFNERYNHHAKALLETEFPSKNDKYFKNSITICCKSRKFLMYSYIFLYFTEKSNQTKIFEHNLRNLESLVELEYWNPKWDLTCLTFNHLLRNIIMEFPEIVWRHLWIMLGKVAMKTIGQWTIKKHFLGLKMPKKNWYLTVFNFSFKINVWLKWNTIYR